MADNNGRISIRVVPDLKGFHRQLKTELEAIERSLSVKIPVEIDKNTIKNAAKVLATEVANIDAPEIRFNRFESALANAIVKINDVNKAVRSMSSSVSTHLRRIVNVRQHWNDVGSAIRNAGKHLTSVRSITNGVFMSLMRVGTASKGLGRLLGRSLTGAAKGALSLTKATKGLLGPLASLASAAGTATAALIPTTRVGFIVAAVFALAAPAIGLVASLLASLPALGAAFLAPIAAIALGFDGIKKAASVLKDEVTTLKNTLSASFQKQLIPVFKQLEKLFPVIQVGLLKVTDGVVNVAKAFVGVITSAQGMKQIGVLLTNVGKFLTDISPAVQSLTQAFLTLAAEGSKSFGQLSGFLNGFFGEFNQIVQAVSGNGVLAGAIEGMTQVFTALGHVFNQLFHQGLIVMAQIGGPLAFVINNLGSILVALMPILVTISNLVSTVFGTAFAALVPIIQALGPPLAQIAALFSTTFAGAIKALEGPVLSVVGSLAQLVTILVNALAPILPPIITVIGALAEIIAGVLASAVTALMPAIQALVPIIGVLANIVGQVLFTAFQALAPIILTILPVIAQLAVLVGQTLLSAIQALMPLITLSIGFFSQLYTALTPLLPAFLQLATALAGAFIEALVLLMPMILQIAQAVLPLLLDAVIQLMPVILQLIDALIQIIPPIMEIVSAILGALMPVIQALLNIIQAVFPKIVSVIQGALNIVIGIVKFFIGLLTGSWSQCWEGIKQILKGAWDFISGAVGAGIQLVVSTVKELPGKILGAIGNLGSLLLNKGKELIQGFIDGITSMASKVASTIRNVASALNPFDLMAPGFGGDSTIVPTVNTGAALQGISAIDGAMAGLTGGDFGISGMAAEAGQGFALSGLQGNISSHIEGSDFGNLEAVIEAALTGWSVQVDGDGLAKLVNKSNARKARR